MNVKEPSGEQNRTIPRTALAGLAVAAVLFAGAAYAQEQDGTVAIGIDVSDAINGSRLYTDQDSLGYDVPLGNESQVAVSVDQQALRRAFSVAVTVGGSNVPVAVRWPDEVSVPDKTGIIISRFSASEPVWLNPGETVWFKLTLTRQDGQRFEEGQYDIAFTLSGFAAAIGHGDGTPWRGVTNARGTWQRGVLIRRPTNAAEQLAAHQAEAILARRRGDRQAALAALQKAAALDPNNRYVRLTLGLAYQGLGRWREAIPIYESLIAGTTQPDRLVARDLATAYVAVRDEANAARVLRWSGVAESEISGTLDTLRRSLR